MEIKWILIPLFAQVLLTFFVGIVMRLRREKAVKEGAEILKEISVRIDKPNNSKIENFKDDYRYTTDGQALAFQIQYHRKHIVVPKSQSKVLEELHVVIG